MPEKRLRTDPPLPHLCAESLKFTQEHTTHTCAAQEELESTCFVWFLLNRTLAARQHACLMHEKVKRTKSKRQH